MILIDRHARVPELGPPRLEVVRASGAAREHGVQARSDALVEAARADRIHPFMRPYLDALAREIPTTLSSHAE